MRHHNFLSHREAAVSIYYSAQIIALVLGMSLQPFSSSIIKLSPHREAQPLSETISPPGTAHKIPNTQNYRCSIISNHILNYKWGTMVNGYFENMMPGM